MGTRDRCRLVCLVVRCLVSFPPSPPPRSFVRWSGLSGWGSRCFWRWVRGFVVVVALPQPLRLPFPPSVAPVPLPGLPALAPHRYWLALREPCDGLATLCILRSWTATTPLVCGGHCCCNYWWMGSACCVSLGDGHRCWPAATLVIESDSAGGRQFTMSSDSFFCFFHNCCLSSLCAFTISFVASWVEFEALTLQLFARHLCIMIGGCSRFRRCQSL